MRANYKGRLVYYHNWYQGHGSEPCRFDRPCPRDYDSHIFWVGIVSTNADTLSEKIAEAHVRNETVQTFVQNMTTIQEYESSSYIYMYGMIPSVTIRHLMCLYLAYQCVLAVWRMGMPPWHAYPLYIDCQKSTKLTDEKVDAFCVYAWVGSV